ncbi:MAG: glycosyltransferase [Candidatus Kapabacteria bacterium]|nr:glycosyltransferase [Candidatus Kapabacteria bacterium]
MNISRCIESIRTYCDEIIVLDTGSEDDTIQKATDFGAKVYQHNWKNDFAEARNISLEYASGDFILVIDADEEFQANSNIREILVNSKNSVGGLLLNVISSASTIDGQSQTFVSPQLRIFRNHQGFKFEGKIHEQIAKSILNSGFEIVKSDLKIIHHGYNLPKNLLDKKHLRNLEMLDDEDLISGNPIYLFHRAKTFLALGYVTKAEQDINQALNKVAKSHVSYPSILNYATVIARNKGEYQDAYFYSIESLKIEPNQLTAHLNLAELFLSANDFANASLHYQIIFDRQKDVAKKISLGGDIELPQEVYVPKMAYCYYRINNFEKANQLLEQFIASKPQNLDAKMVKLNFLLREGKIEEFMNLLNEISRIIPNDSTIINLKSKYSETSEFKQKNPKISLSMIVKNEEKMLEGCLESVQSFVDEIVIVDTGSTDDTVKIAQKYNAKVFHYEWNDNFSDARNFALKHTSGDWILYLDADERLNNKNYSSIRNILENATDEVGALLCTIESLHRKDDGSSEMHRGSYPRLFRNYGYPTIKFTGKVHEQITPALRQLNKQIFESDIVIEHLGYNFDLQTIRDKTIRNYQLLIKQVNDEPTNGYAWFQLGQTLGRLKLVEQSIMALEFAIGTETLSDSIKAATYTSLSQLKGVMKEFDKALDYVEKSLQINPNQLFARNLKAYALLHLGRFEQSRQMFEAILATYDTKANSQIAFDIEVPRNIVLQGLEMAKKRIITI